MKKRKYPIKMPLKKDVLEFLEQSNAIEGVYGKEALDDAKKAWDFLIAKEHVTAEDVLRVHKLLMKRLRPDIAGQLRDCDVWIGGQHKKFIDKEVLLYQLNNALSAIWMSFGMLSQLVPSNAHLACDCHVMFENVHPFEDGNGRVGRILYNWHRLNMGESLHIIHTGEEQHDYYLWFRQKLPIWNNTWNSNEAPTKEPKPLDKRIESMVEMKLDGKTLKAIGLKHGVTRERVRQLLFLTGVKFPNARWPKRAVLVSKVCRFCQKNFSVLPSSFRRVFCSRDCMGAYSKRSKEQRPAKHRVDSRKWYLRHKDDPQFKKVTKLRNEGIRGRSIHDPNL